MTDLYFPLASDKTLSADVGITGLASLPALFALEATTQTDYEGTTNGFRFQTDRKGLLSALTMGHNAQEALSDALTCIGRLTAHADHREIDVAAVGWLLAGLGELKTKVDDSMVYIALALAHGDHLPDAPGREGHNGQ